MGGGASFRIRAARLGLAVGLLGGALAAGTASAVWTGATPAAATVCTTPTITSANGTTVNAGAAFTFTVTTCSPSTPTFKETMLPSGITLTDNGNGTATISGTPTVAQAGVHIATITATVTGLRAGSQKFTLTVDNPPTFSTPAHYTDVKGGAVSVTVKAAHAYPVPAYSATGLPSGVTLTDLGKGSAVLAYTGSGLEGTYSFSLAAVNTIAGVVETAVQSYTLTINQAPAITNGQSYQVAPGKAMTPFTLTATGYPAPVFHATGLPRGIRLTNNGGGTATISGTPSSTDSGTYAVSLSAVNGAGTAKQTFGLKIAGPKTGVVGLTATHDGAGYWLVDNDGTVTSFGDAIGVVPAPFDLTGDGITDIVGLTASADGLGYWMFSNLGAMFTFGDAPFYGSNGPLGINTVVGMASHPDGLGYWFTDINGNVHGYGDAMYYGGIGGQSVTDIAGITSTPDGGGYWLVGGNGGVFAFGDAGFYGAL